MKRRRLLLSMLALACLAPAQVFWRRPAAPPSAWQQAYDAPVRLQEGSGNAALFGVEGSLRQIENDLRARHGENLVWMPGEHVAWGLAMESGMLHRYLVQPRPEAEHYWVLHTRQREREATPPGKQPGQHQLTDLPALAGSQPTFYTKDEDNHLAVEVSMSLANPGSALEQLSDALQQDGWVASPTNTGGMRLFIQRDQLAILSATPGADGFTRIVRLHKPLGVE